VRRALEKCELVIVSDCIRHTDTTKYAHVLLPGRGLGREGGHGHQLRAAHLASARVSETVRRDATGLVDGAEVAKRLGHGAAFDYPNAAAIFREHAALSAVANDGTRDFDLSGLAEVSDEAYAQLAPIQWPVTAQQPHGTVRLFGDGNFFTPSGRARFLAITPRPPANPTDSDYPLALNTGRVRDHWHTMTRTGLAARLSAHSIEPYIEIHPQTPQAVPWPTAHWRG